MAARPQRCNFMFDCPVDSADERDCPQYFNFESCETAEKCYWTDLESRGLHWRLSTGQLVQQGNLTSGPDIDLRNR